MEMMSFRGVGLDAARSTSNLRRFLVFPNFIYGWDRGRRLSEYVLTKGALIV